MYMNFNECFEKSLKVKTFFIIFFFQQDGVGLTAINDSFFLESAVFQILRKHIRDQPYYLSVVELFQDVSLLFVC